MHTFDNIGDFFDSTIWKGQFYYTSKPYRKWFSWIYVAIYEDTADNLQRGFESLLVGVYATLLQAKHAVLHYDRAQCLVPERQHQRRHLHQQLTIEVTIHQDFFPVQIYIK